MQRSRLLNLISCVYDGVGNRGAWELVVRDLVDYFGADAGDLVTEDEKNRTLDLYGSAGYDPAFLKIYRTEYSGMDVLSEAARKSRIVGPIHSEADFVPKQEFLKSRFYNEWMRPQAGLRYGVGASLENNGKTFTNVYLMRPRSSGPYSDRDSRRLAAFIPHLQHAIRLSRRIRGLEVNFQTALLALDRSRLPMVVLDRSGSAIHISEAAERLISHDSWILQEIRGEFKPSAYNEAQKLRKAIRRATLTAAIDTNDQSLSKAGESFLVLRRFPSRPLGVFVIPVPYQEGQFDEPVWRVLLVFIDPHQGNGVQEGWLRQLFGFTKTEAQFALKFAAGKSVEQCADEMGFGLGTARWHLKNIRNKAGTPRQVELSRVLNNALRFS